MMNQYPKSIMLLGSGELGKEIAIAAQRLGCNVIACDRYANAPAMQVADYFEVLDMTNENQLQLIIRKHNPDYVVPEIEALAVNTLVEIEKEGIEIIPTAKTTAITMNRDQIRDLAHKKLGIKTAKFAYASNAKELVAVGKQMGFPLIVKPVMSSSGKGQTLVHDSKSLELAWETAIASARGKSRKVIAEEFIDFELEITLLTIRQRKGETLFCQPIGHEQKNGDYQCSWQPAELNKKQLSLAQSMAHQITQELGGVGLFGVEFFISGDDVIFSELSPRPHDTGLVTLMSQNLSEFELHLRAILGIPIPEITLQDSSASRVILSNSSIESVAYRGIEKALEEPNTSVLIFGKPDSKKGRRMGVALSRAKNIQEAKLKADKAAKAIEVFEL